MADVLHRTTKQFRPSVNAFEHPSRDWIHNPTIGGARFRDAGVPGKYCNISGDTVTEMSRGEKDAVDAAEADAVFAANKAAAKSELLGTLWTGVIKHIASLDVTRDEAQTRAAIEAAIDSVTR